MSRGDPRALKPYLPRTLSFGAHLATHNPALVLPVFSFFQNRYFSTWIFNCIKQKFQAVGGYEG